MRQIIELTIGTVEAVHGVHRADGDAHYEATLDCGHTVEGWMYGQGSTLREIAASAVTRLTSMEHHCSKCIPNEPDQASCLFRTTYLGITKAVAAHNGHNDTGHNWTFTQKFPELFPND